MLSILIKVWVVVLRRGEMLIRDVNLVEYGDGKTCMSEVKLRLGRALR